MGEGRHFFLLVWKNLKLKYRQPLKTFIEVFIPCLCITVLFMFVHHSHGESRVSETIYEPYNINKIPDKNGKSEGMVVFYSPQYPFFHKVMKDVARKLNFTPLSYNTEREMVEAYENSTSNVIAGIVFQNHLPEQLNTIKNIEYKIRLETIPRYLLNVNHVFSKLPVLGPKDINSTWGTNYMTLGFLPLQHAISMSLMNNLFPNSSKSIKDKLSVYMQRFPEPPYVRKNIYFKPKFIIIILICVGYLLPIANFTQNVVKEKEKRLKVVLKAMGVANWMNLTTWNIFELSYIKDQSHIFKIILRNESVLFLSETKSTTTDIAAMGGAFIAFFLSLMPYMHMRLFTHKISTTAFIVFSLFPNTILGYSMQTVIQLEEMGIGLQWKNINFTGSSSLELSAKNALFILVGDTVIFFLLSWYIEAVFPGKMSEGQPWYFLFTSVYWTGHKRSETEAIESFGLHELKPEYFEREPYGVRPSIEFKNLTKIFKKRSRPTLKKVFFKAYRNQITVLLGHDGTGKSTVISTLLGHYRPTSGKAFIKGCNVSIESEARKIPRFLGFCPDYDVHFDHLSVEENLYFFCKMKGFESEGISSQIDHVLGILDLELKRKTKAGILSACWKRKLSVALALIGESEIVVMDDPTNHMDPYSRRIMWEALQTEKAYRTIFITTSHMDEAEAIGDRIGIIDEGELQCFGSTAFVKKLYGAGYHLIIEIEDSCNVTQVTNLIKDHVSSARMYHSNETLKYILPHDESPMFQFLFSELEKKKDNLKIIDFSLLQISMKDIFDKVSLKASSSYEIPDFKSDDTFNNTGMDDDSQNLLFVKERSEGFSLFIQQAVAVLKKRFKISIHYPLLFLSQLLVLSIISIASNAFVDEEIVFDKPLKLNLCLYNVSGIPMKVQYAVNPSSKHAKDLADAFASLFDVKNQPFLVDLREETLNEHLLEIAERNPFDYFKSHFMAVDFSSDSDSSTITAYYNNKAFHSPALSLLYVHNTFLRYITNGSDLYSFKVTNHPFHPKYPKMAMVSKATLLLSKFLVAQDMMFAISIVMAGFIVPLTVEKSSHFKKLQFINGLNRVFYWILSFLYDFGLYILACTLFIIVLTSTGLYGSSYVDQLAHIIIFLMIHGIAGLLFVYCCSFFSRSPSTGYIFIFLYHMLGFILQILVLVMKEKVLKNTYEYLNILFSLFLPCYAFIQGFLNLYKNWMNNQICNNDKVQLSCQKTYDALKFFELNCCKEKCGTSCYEWEDNFFSWQEPGIGKQIILSLAQMFIFIAIIILLEYRIFQFMKFKFLHFLRVKQRTSNEQISESSSEPSLSSNQYLVVKELSKYFGSKCAIKNLTFKVSRGESFGLIGGAKSGKTTFVNIITGQLSVFQGRVYIDGKDIMKLPVTVEEKIGLCPEYNALLHSLTGEETLLFFANLNGITKQKIQDCISYFSRILSLDDHLKQKVEEYSYIVKRKLNVAIALIGAPPLVVLDEPTTKMDPISSRCVLNALLQASNFGCTILLASQRSD
ncbi:ATP-binding cassette sub-family A member 3 [Nephila pilipes]|uniref:ATP-binding cassette sub-family A member 3 n=1 Tax=Nephila pilipes TaxID=299642 RepID=A0A8X6TU31_NEPPI|nr:ATP-binding cassette sub-family A member 3 [Nephila pilipes]